MSGESPEVRYNVCLIASTCGSAAACSRNRCTEVLSGESKLLSFVPTINLERARQPYATISKRPFTFLHQAYDIAMAGGATYETEGDITNHEYTVSGPAGQVAQISRAWFSIRDAYGVAVAPGADVPLLLAAAVCIEEISERERERNR